MKHLPTRTPEEISARIAARRAEELDYWSQPENLAWRRSELERMRRCLNAPETGPRYAIGAEMDARSVTAAEIASAEAYIAACEAHAAAKLQVAA